MAPQVEDVLEVVELVGGHPHCCLSLCWYLLMVKIWSGNQGLVVVLVSPSEPSVVFDTPSELAVKGLTVKLGLIVLCVNPFRIFYFTGA